MRIGLRRRLPALPGFLIIGAMKAGTTSLAAWLSEHPDIYLPREKELHFFDSGWDRGVEWYGRQFADAVDGCIAGEATPSYMTHASYLQRIRAVLPRVKLVALLRNPVERAWSQYRHMVALGDRSWQQLEALDGRKGPRDFDEVIQLELSLDPDDWRTSGLCLARGRYIDQLRCLDALFPREQIGVYLFDDLVANPESCFRAVCGFIGAASDVTPEIVGQPFDPIEILAASSSDQTRRDLISIQNAGPPAVASQALPREWREELIDYYRPYNTELEQWLGIDLTSWNR